MQKYKIGTTIQRVDGTFDYCVEELIMVINGVPGYQEVFRGTLEECENKKKELEKENE